MTTPRFQDRIKELRRVPASQLRANPSNWRKHPPSQQRMQGMGLEPRLLDA